MIAPLFFEMSLIFLYSSIRYDLLDPRAILGAIVFFFWIVAMYVMSPFLLVMFGNFERRFGEKITQGLHEVLIPLDTKTKDEPLHSSLNLDLNVAKEEREEVLKSIENSLVPQLSRHAVKYYIDSFYSRDYEKSNRRALDNLEYYESLALFSIYCAFFLLIDIILIWIMKFYTVELFFITLDRIETWNFVYAFSIIFVFGILFLTYAFIHSLPYIDEYVSFTVPIMFRESSMSSFIRKESIRAIVSYNFDNLVSRKEQRQIANTISNTLDHLLHDLLEDELMITSRKRLALKLAWREYAKYLRERVEIKETQGKQRFLDRLLLGEKIGKMQIDESELLGLNSDLSFIRGQLNKWQKLNSAQRTLVFLSLYRITERLIKEAVSSFVDLDEQPLNFFEQTRVLLEKNILSTSAYDKINEFRYTRNKLIHEPGMSLDVSSNVISQVLTALNQMVGKMAKLTDEAEE